MKPTGSLRLPKHDPVFASGFHSDNNESHAGQDVLCDNTVDAKQEIIINLQYISRAKSGSNFFAGAYAEFMCSFCTDPDLRGP